MEITEYPYIEKELLNPCFAYFKENGIALHDAYKIKCYSDHSIFKYLIFIDRSEEKDKDDSNTYLYYHIHFFVLCNNKVVMYYNGYWTNLKNLLTHDAFISNLRNTNEALYIKALDYRQYLVDKCIEYSKKDGFHYIRKTPKIAFTYLDKHTVIDVNDHYVNIGDDFRFYNLESSSNMEGISDRAWLIRNAREIIASYIRLDFDIESDDEITQFYFMGTEHYVESIGNYFVRHPLEFRKNSIGLEIAKGFFKTESKPVSDEYTFKSLPLS